MYTTIKKEELKKLVIGALTKHGETQENAEILYDLMYEDEISGKSSHGFYRLPMFMGSLSPDVKKDAVEVTVNGNVISVDGKKNIGVIPIKKAVDKIIELSETQNIIVAGVNNYENNTGAIGYYARKLAKAGLISIITVSSEACVVPHGGMDLMLGTNPVAMGFPCGDNPVITDVTTAAMPWGRIAVLGKAGQPVPDGVIMDKDGNPSNDPDDLIKRGGKQLPLAGHKGYALGVAMEILGGIFVGGKGGKHSVPGSDAAFIVAMKKDAFIPAEEYEAKMAAFVDEVKNSTKAPGVDEIRIPGMLGPDYFKMAESDEITILTTIYNDILKYA
ncbi:MAG: Ldh family oxidoreductase [Firmicutes bacterium]|nr:Ldh family oxidoreductase [Bacillota bacterium]